MRKLALRVRTRAFIPLVLSAHLQLQPTRVLAVQQAIHRCGGAVFMLTMIIWYRRTTLIRYLLSARHTIIQKLDDSQTIFDIPLNIIDDAVQHM